MESRSTRILALLLGAGVVRGWQPAAGRWTQASQHKATQHVSAFTRVRPSGVALSSTESTPTSALRTLSDCENAFQRIYNKPVYPPYSGIVDEIFGSLVITLADGRYAYTRLFALGLYTIISSALVKPPAVSRGVALREVDVELAEAVCAALQLKWATIERDAKGMLEWASALSEPQILALVSGQAAVLPNDGAPADTASASAEAAGSDSDNKAPARPFGAPLDAMRSLFAAKLGRQPGAGAGAGSSEYPKDLQTLAQSSYPFYHRSLAIATAALTEACGATPRLGALRRWSGALGLQERKVVRDYEWWLGALQKVQEWEERKMEDEVRKMKARADALRAEATEAQRKADAAEGVTGKPAAESDVAASQNAAEAVLGEALAEIKP